MTRRRKKVVETAKYDKAKGREVIKYMKIKVDDE